MNCSDKNDSDPDCDCTHEYRRAKIFEYTCKSQGRQQRKCCLEYLGTLDEKFERCIQTNKVLRSAFERLSVPDQKCDNHASYSEGDIDELANLFLEMGFSIRAKVALEQKIELARSQDHIISQSERAAVTDLVNEELAQTYLLLDSIPSLSENGRKLKKAVKDCKCCELEQFLDLEDNVSTRGEGVSDKHADDYDLDLSDEESLINQDMEQSMKEIHVILPDNLSNS